MDLSRGDFQDFQETKNVINLFKIYDKERMIRMPLIL